MEVLHKLHLFIIQTLKLFYLSLQKKDINSSGWTGSNGSTPQITAKIPKCSRGDRHFVANFEEEPLFAEVYTTSTNSSRAVIKIKEYYPSYSEQEIAHSSSSKTFSRFSISYSSLQWHLTTSLDNIYYATSADTPLSEYKKLDIQNWSYQTTVHYYLAIK